MLPLNVFLNSGELVDAVGDEAGDQQQTTDDDHDHDDDYQRCVYTE